MKNNKGVILIVEDEQIVGENLRESLIENGYSVPVLPCVTGEEAIRKAGEIRPDLILMDIKLEGEMDGVEAVEAIRKEMNVPVIYLTAYSNEGFLERAERTGPFGYINKPYKTNDVLVNVRMALYKHGMEKKEKKKTGTETKVEDFIAHITHEMRNPLGVIMGYSTLLKDFGASEEQLKFIRKIEKSTEKTSRLVDDLLDYSRMKVGKFTMNPGEFDLREKMNHLSDTYSRMFGEKGLELRLDIGPGVPGVIVGDPVRLEQVLANLLGNALKFTEKGSCGVTVARKPPVEEGKKENKAGENNVTLLFSVKDTGIGIPGNKKDAVFEAFEQADPSITGKYGGTGLGLAITKQLVEMMDGEISVDSEPGKGSTFTFTAVFGTG